MDEHVLNELHIDTETDEELLAVLSFIKDDEDMLDFNKIVPLPSHPSKVEKELAFELWGTCWNATDARILHTQECVSFITYGSPPTLLVKKLSLIFPEVTFTIDYEVVSDERPEHASITYKDGVEIDKLVSPNFWKVTGYFKDDKTRIDGAIVKETHDVSDDDEDVFYYGMSFADLQRAVEEGENFNEDFVIESFKPL
jgi:hypothetical protein